MARSTPAGKTPRSGNTTARRQDGPDDNALACDRAAVQQRQQQVAALSCGIALDTTQAAEA